MKILYKLSKIFILIDIVTLLLSLYIVFDWFPLTTNTPYSKYSVASLCYVSSWFIFSYISRRYLYERNKQYFKSILRLLYIVAINFLLYWALIHFFFKPFSGYVLLGITLIIFVVNYIFISIYFAYCFAAEFNELNFDYIDQRVNAIAKPSTALDAESYNQLCTTIKSHSSKSVLKFLQKNIDLNNSGTFVYITNDAENLKLIPHYTFSSIVQLERLNNMQGVNDKLAVINKMLPDNGLFVCCFESKSTKKKSLLKKYPIGINYLVYIIYFIYKRILPKFIITKRLYYKFTDGKNRVFSKAEVLGRLYCYGFKVINEKKIGGLTYVVSERVKQPATKQKKIYGPIIRLRRYGFEGSQFEVYKMRTMHPYSEFLQHYIYERNSLKAGGKFNKDIRVTSMGSFMRKYWLDELPMIVNVLKGDLKLVGVRPLSRQYFDLYSPELQQRRSKFKPGLLPPFYADMPKTIEEIQDSEMRYLDMCEKKGVFLADLIYLFRIAKNILFKQARSS